jgi:hypothetical protein
VGPHYVALRLYRGANWSRHLRCFTGDCTIKLADQAAEANHPYSGREGLPLTKDIFGPQASTFDGSPKRL